MANDRQPNRNPARFDALAAAYDAWYDENAALFAAEIEAVRAFLLPGRGLEIGAGSGRFTAALGLAEGIEPAAGMRRLAAARGVRLTDAVAEALPYGDESFANVCFLTSLEFVEDAKAALREARRVLRPGGRLIVAHLNAASPEGAALAAGKSETDYFPEATFYSTEPLYRLLESCGFARGDTRQIVHEAGRPVIRDGSGDGLYTVLSATR